MLVNPRKFFGGLALMTAFTAVLVVMFLPIFDGRNALDYMDSLFNSVSKGSAYYVPELRAQAEDRRGDAVAVTLAAADETQARQMADLLRAGGATAQVTEGAIRVSGDLGGILARALQDSDEMFANAGAGVRDRYGYQERRVLFNWWTALKTMEEDLKRQSRFAEAAFVAKVKEKAVECAYNYFGIEPWKVSDRIGLVLFSLAFYVVYTVWYGYAIIFLLEGWGFTLSH
jgi:hypothetical protein